jgi:Holliday junction resolvasome RuvABC endonuclease subunit
MSERLLSFDPGAERCGWCVLTRDSKRGKRSAPEAKGLGYFGIPRKVNEGKKTDYQPYRLSLLDLWIEKAPHLIESYEPEEIVSEIVPPVGSGGFVVATQSQLALCAITAIQVVAKQRGIPIAQVGATTVKTRIGGGKKATKVAVRNGVFKIIPDLEDRKKEWSKMFDVSDAVAIGLTHWEYDNRG